MYDNIIVNVSASNMRAWGRQALAGKWKMAILGTFLYLLLSIGPQVLITAFFSQKAMVFAVNLYTFLVTGPLLLGYTVFMIAIFRRQPTKPSEVFYGFEKFGKTFGLYFMVTLFTLLWGLLFIVPGIIAAIRYSMAFYVLADNPEIGIMDAIEESKRMMYGNKMTYFSLQLSFIGWILLASVPSIVFSILSISMIDFTDVASMTNMAQSGGNHMASVASYLTNLGLVFVLPYITASSVGFYEVANGNLKPRIVEFTAELENTESVQQIEAEKEDHKTGE